MGLNKKHFAFRTARRWIGLGLLGMLSYQAHSAPLPIPTSCEGMKEGLIACYPFDGNTNDLSGKNYHGVAKNITFVEGKAGKAAHFDGKTSYIEIASNQDLNSPQITFATWVKPTFAVTNKGVSTGHGIIFNKELQYELAIFEDDYAQVKAGELSFAFGSYWEWMGTGTSLPPNKFAHIALAYTKDSMAKLYVDGKLVKVQKYNGGFGANDLCLRIGTRNCPKTTPPFLSERDLFEGDMDEFRIYNRELSEAEIKQLAGVAEEIKQPVNNTNDQPKYAIPSACQGVKEGLVACYPFDGNTNDLSGKNYHGKVAGNLTYVTGQAGQAAHFDGSNYVEVADTPDLNSPQMSFAAWVKPLSLEKPSTEPAGFTNHHSVFNKEPQYSLSLFGESYMKDRVKAGELSFQFNPNWLYVPTNYTPSLNQFIHVVLTFDQSNAGKLYINGNLIKEEQYGKPLKTPAEVESVIHMKVSNLRIGASTCLPILGRKCPTPDVHSFFNGDIDEFRVYNRSLSDLEVKQLAGIEPIKSVEQPIEKYTLSAISLGLGKGSVRAEGVELKCVARECQHDFPAGSKVTLIATPEPQSVLKEWGNDCAGMTTPTVTVTLDKAKKCTAVFMPEQVAPPPPPPPPVSFNLNVTKTGSGDVKSVDNSINCGTVCQHGYVSNTNVNLTATPAAGYSFKEWSGDCAGNNPLISLVIDKTRNCAATFIQQQAAPTPVPVGESQLCTNMTGTFGQDRAGYCNDYTFEGNNVPCVINKGGEIIAGECAQDQLNPKPLADKVLAYGKHAFVGKSFSTATPRCDSSVEFSAENKTKAPSNMAFLCVRYEKAAGSNSFYYGLAFVNNAQVLSYKFETTPDRCVGTCPK